MHDLFWLGLAIACYLLGRSSQRLATHDDEATRPRGPMIVNPPPTAEDLARRPPAPRGSGVAVGRIPPANGATPGVGRYSPE